MLRKQIFYLTNDQLTVYPWAKGGHVNGHSFTNDEAGWEGFSRYLAGSSGTPSYLLADLIEEDFQRDSLPHVLGKSGRALLQRRLAQLYRDTPYRQAVSQGREPQGRKDDRMLFSALTNAELLKPWLDAILQHQVPLAGIASPALLSAALIKKLELSSENLLLVTHQSSGVRQSFFSGAQLKFSRLTPLVDHSPAFVAETVARETANTQQFLLSARLLPRGETLDTVVLAHSDYLPHLQSACRDTPVTTHCFLELVDIAARFALKKPDSVLLCDALFLSLQGQSSPGSHYAQPEQTRFFRLRQVRHFLYVLSAGLLAGALLPAGSDSLDALHYYEQSRQMSWESSALQSQSQAIIQSLPPTAISPENMKAAVNVEQMLSRNAPGPALLLGIVSRALNTVPQIRIEQLHWQVSNTQETAGAGGLRAAPQVAPLPGVEVQADAALVGIPRKPAQILLIEGTVASFNQDYRTALEHVRVLVAELGKTPQLQIEITNSPLNTASSAKLSGKAGDEDSADKALFALKLMLKPGD